jgi:succinate dehydrogenase/fumarate reductase iron-sulfur protein
MATQATFRIWRGDPAGGTFQDYTTPVEEGMVVLDAVHRIQAHQANDLAVRWNCKAGKCGSCSAEINGMPKLMCMTRLSEINLEMPVILEPMHAFPPIRDLVTDVSWNFRAKKTIKQFKPRTPDEPDGTWRIQQADVERVFSVRMSVTFCANTTNTTSSSARACSSTPLRSKCTRSISRTVSVTCAASTTSAIATSQPVADKSAPSRLRLPKTQSSRSRSGSWTGSSIL